MTGAEFREELARLGFSQAGFSRFLAARGHAASEASIARSVRRWAEIGPSSEIVVILSLLRERAASAA